MDCGKNKMSFNMFEDENNNCELKVDNVCELPIDDSVISILHKCRKAAETEKAETSADTRLDDKVLCDVFSKGLHYDEKDEQSMFNSLWHHTSTNGWVSIANLLSQEQDCKTCKSDILLGDIKPNIEMREESESDVSLSDFLSLDSGFFDVSLLASIGAVTDGFSDAEEREENAKNSSTALSVPQSPSLPGTDIASVSTSLSVSATNVTSISSSSNVLATSVTSVATLQSVPTTAVTSVSTSPSIFSASYFHSSTAAALLHANSSVISDASDSTQTLLSNNLTKLDDTETLASNAVATESCPVVTDTSTVDIPVVPCRRPERVFSVSSGAVRHHPYRKAPDYAQPTHVSMLKLYREHRDLNDLLLCQTRRVYASKTKVERTINAYMLLEHKNSDYSKPRFENYRFQRATREETRNIIGRMEEIHDDLDDVPFSASDIQNFSEKRQMAQELDQMLCRTY